MPETSINTPAFTPLASRDIATSIHPYTNLKLHETEGPLVITEGDGVFVRGEDGKTYLEGLAGLWCVSLGFSERRLAEAAYRQMLKLPYYHTFAHKAHDIGIELAEKLLSIAPAPMSKVFFVNSGSEANDTAVKLVWYYNNAIGRPRKKKILSRSKAYHGVTVASASLTGLPNNHRDFDLPIANIMHVECPHYYRFGQPGETEEAFASRMAESLEQRILKEDPETVAAMIAEPVMGAGGVLLPPATYFEKIQAVLKKYDVMLIADEVISAFGRTGEMWGSTTFGMKPDMITCAKALSSGYMPIGAVMISPAIYDALRKAVRKNRGVQPRLHVQRASRDIRGGSGDAEDLRGARHPLPRSQRGAAHAGGAAPFRGPSAGGRGSGHRAGWRC